MKTKFRLTGILAAVLLFSALLTGIFLHSRSHTSTAVDLYFPNSSASTITAETHSFDFDGSPELFDDIMKALSRGSSAGEHSVPRGAKWNFEQNGTELLIDFSKPLNADDETKNLLCAYAVIKTMCQLDGITAVKITVGGKDIIAPDGNPLGYLADKDINLESDSHTSENKVIKLYFSDGEGNLLAEHRNVRLSEGVPIEQYVVTELIKGPKHNTLTAAISADTKLLSAEVTDSTAYINLNKSFIEKNRGSKSKELLAVYSIVNSVCDASGVGDVQLLIEGKKEQGFENVDISGILHRRADLIKGSL